MRLLPLMLCGLMTLPSWAEETTVYKRVRPDGTVEFSDEPTPGASEVEIAPLVTYPSQPAPRNDSRARAESPAPPTFRYERLQITEPAADGTVFFDEKGMPVTVTIAPPLQPDHVVTLYLDGKAAASGPSGRFTLQDVFRGTHTLTAAVEDGGGETLLRSAPVTFHLIQHTRR